jgi:hypothetical protein
LRKLKQKNIAIKNIYRIKKDGDGFLAEIIGQNNLFAYGETEEEAKQELIYVVDMMIDFHQETLSKEKNIVLPLHNAVFISRFFSSIKKIRI